MLEGKKRETEQTHFHAVKTDFGGRVKPQGGHLSVSCASVSLPIKVAWEILISNGSSCSSTMSRDDIMNGRLICNIGIAPTRPAEFVVFRVSQMTAEAGGGEAAE